MRSTTSVPRCACPRSSSLPPRLLGLSQNENGYLRYGVVAWWARGVTKRRSVALVRLAAQVKAASIIFPNREVFDAKKSILMKAGIDALQVVADFDRTLTAAFTSKGTATRVNPFALYITIFCI